MSFLVVGLFCGLGGFSFFRFFLSFGGFVSDFWFLFFLFACLLAFSGGNRNVGTLSRAHFLQDYSAVKGVSVPPFETIK